MACSGGLDSLLLLYVLAALCPQRLLVVHIDHQLQKASGTWAKLVEQQCLALNLPYRVVPVCVAQQGNLEANARSARQQAFYNELHAGDVLVFAHHQQDQAETVMLRLLSGAGVQGLAAMRLWEQRAQPFSHFIYRPFLTLSRSQLQTWADHLQLPYVHDPMNDDVHYDRVWCRQVLWNVLEQRFPKMQHAIARTSQIMHDADEILHEVAMQDWASCGDKNHLNIQQLQQFRLARQRQILSLWMKGDDDYRPSFDKVQRLFDEVIHAKIDAQSCLYFNQFYYVRYADTLYRYHQQQWQQFQQSPSAFTFCPALGISLHLTTGVFTLQSGQKIGLSSQLIGQQLSIKNRQDGLKLRLYQRQGAKSLKKFLQEQNIEPWRRLGVQFLYVQEQLLGVFTPKQFYIVASDWLEQDGWLPVLGQNNRLNEGEHDE